MDLPVNLKLKKMQIQKTALTARKKKKGGDKDLRTKYQTTQIKTHTVSALSSSEDKHDKECFALHLTYALCSD